MKILTFQRPEKLLFAAAMVATCLIAALFSTQVAAGSGYGADLRKNNKELRAQLALLKKATSGFNSYDVARAAGWNAIISDCVSSPAGGMGYHVANMAALDEKPFELSLLQPEVLLFAPLPDGSMEFVGVEYIVPHHPEFAPNAPSFLGQELEYNEHLNIWALHVWIERHNPSGIFAPFNPDVTCAAD